VFQQYIAIAIFAAVYALIIVGRTRRYHIPIWVSMLIGAFLMIVFQVIGLESAFKSINLDVIGFLFGMLIALAFGISVGSTMTPIGNPQNLLIAIQSGISLPFTTFIIHLTIPTLINLFLTYFILRMYFKKDLLLLNGKRYRDQP
jgi:Na+/H+ antiporter NhaD/arsenite permease-like protein